MTTSPLPAGPGPDEKAAWRSALRRSRRAAVADGAGRARRAAQGAALRDVLAAELAARGIGTGATVAAFAPSPTEPDLMPWLRGAVSGGRTVLLPVATGTEQLEWVAWNGRTDLAPSPARGFGDEPVGERLGPGAIGTAAAIVAPALAVDRSGTRLGHGGGFYDRTLAQHAPATPVLVVVHPEEVLPAGALPRQAHDARFDVAVTAAGAVRPE